MKIAGSIEPEDVELIRHIGIVQAFREDWQQEPPPVGTRARSHLPWRWLRLR